MDIIQGKQDSVLNKTITKEYIYNIQPASQPVSQAAPAIEYFI